MPPRPAAPLRNPRRFRVLMITHGSAMRGVPWQGYSPHCVITPPASPCPCDTVRTLGSRPRNSKPKQMTSPSRGPIDLLAVLGRRRRVSGWTEIQPGSFGSVGAISLATAATGIRYNRHSGAFTFFDPPLILGESEIRDVQLRGAPDEFETRGSWAEPVLLAPCLLKTTSFVAGA